MRSFSRIVVRTRPEWPARSVEIDPVREEGGSRAVQPGGPGSARGEAGPRRMGRPQEDFTISGLILDDIEHVQYSRGAVEVLLNLPMRRSERGRHADKQPAVLGMGVDLQEPDGDGGGDRPPRTSRRRPATECLQQRWVSRRPPSGHMTGHDFRRR
jgi:hypothetical protein